MIARIKEKVKRYIEEQKLIQKGDTIIVGVSGGADSMMLLHFLNSHKAFYDIKLKVAHVHHGIRKEADDDRDYVKEICREWQIPCYIHACNIKELASLNKISEEEAGRIERYNFFISLTNQNDKIATAHNTNDQAETMIMRFLRGADVKGLRGIQPKRDNIIRPILCLTREEIETYCKEYKINYHDDHTNFETIYTRNKIRLECIPYIRQHFNENIVSTLFEHSQLYQEEEAFLEDYIQKVFEKVVTKADMQLKISINALAQEKVYIQKKLIHKCLESFIGHSKDITLLHVKSVLELVERQNGKKICLPYETVAHRVYEHIVLSKENEGVISNYEYTLELGINNIEDLDMQLHLQCVPRKTFEQSQQNMYTKYVDYDKIRDSLHLRTRRVDDYIVLQNGSKKLKKLYIDEKIPQHKRSTHPIIADGNEVVWVLDSRLNIDYFVTDQTRHILEIKVIK